MKTGFLRITKCWLLLWLKLIVFPIIKWQKMSQFYICFLKKPWALASLGCILAKQTLSEAELWLYFDHLLKPHGCPLDTEAVVQCLSFWFSLAFLNILSCSFNSFKLIVYPQGSGWNCWMASLTQWTWVWVHYGSWWWTGRPGVLQSMGLQRIRHDRETELNWHNDILVAEYPQWPDFGLSIPFFIERNRTPKTGLYLLHLSSLIKVVLRLACPLSVT